MHLVRRPQDPSCSRSRGTSGISLHLPSSSPWLSLVSGRAKALLEYVSSLPPSFEARCGHQLSPGQACPTDTCMMTASGRVHAGRPLLFASITHTHTRRVVRGTPSRRDAASQLNAHTVSPGTAMHTNTCIRLFVGNAARPSVQAHSSCVWCRRYTWQTQTNAAGTRMYTQVC